jgi:membrane associated rhomboid family serine protease
MFQANPIIKSIIFINTVIYLLLSMKSVIAYGFVPANPSALTVFTSMFLHADLMHVGFNMLFLYSLNKVERDLGKLWFAGTYFVSGLTAVGFHYITNIDSTIPMVGASGAVCGVAGAAYVILPNEKIIGTFNPKIWEWFKGKILISPISKSFVKWFFILNAICGIATILLPWQGGVAWWAHVGGVISGYGIAKAFVALYPDDLNKPIKKNFTLRNAWSIKK